jgi:fatty-acid desaturase
MRKNVWRIDGLGANALDGQVVWAPVKSIWNTTIFVLAIVLAPTHSSWGAFVLFLALSYVTLLLGHSLGMHRRLIHRTYDCPKELERVLVWLGVLVGMAGPFGILRIHDVRDWAQRQELCHDFFAHRRGLWLDAFWQLHCTFRFKSPPRFVIEPEFGGDRWYRFMESTWRLHQLALAAILYALGGLNWVVWGVFVRIAVSVTSHWVVTYFAHNPGPGGSYPVLPCRHRTCQAGASSPMASAGITTTMHFPSQREWASVLENWTPAGRFFGCSKRWAWSTTLEYRERKACAMT